MKPKSILRSFLFATIAISSASAADITWDIAPGTVGVGNGTVTGGLGTWNTANGNWTADAGANNIAWDNLNNDTAIFGGTAGAVTLGANVTVGGLTFNTNSYSVAPGGFGITFGAAGDINVSTGTTNITAPISGSAITKTGGGALTLSVANTFSGLSLNGGTVNVNGATDSLGAAGSTITVLGNTTLQQGGSGAISLNKSLNVSSGTLTFVHGNNSWTIQGAVSGSGTIKVNDAGSDDQRPLGLINTGNTSFTGAIDLTNNRATVKVASLGDSMGAGNIIFGGNSSLFYLGTEAVTAMTLTNRVFEFQGTATTATILNKNTASSSANTLTINSNLAVTTAGAKDLRLGGANLGANTFDGDIVDGSGIVSLTKQEAGKWILSGANTYTGNTTIIDGTLEIRGAGQLGAGGVYPGNITSTDTTPSPFTFDSSANTTISGVISGTMPFIKDGAGTLTITGSAIHTGGTTVDDGTLSLGNGTNNAKLSDFAVLSVATGAVLNLNYTGSDAVLNLNLGGSPMAAGQYGHTTSGATNGGAGVGFYDAFFASNSGTINNLAGDTTSVGAAFWDGGAIDIGTNGNLSSAGGNGTWDTTILNWDYGTVPHAAYLNTTSTTAYFGGVTGTVTLGANMNIENMNIEVPSAGGTGYFIGEATEDNTLTFGGTKTVSVTATGTGTNQDATIRAGIAGSPTMNITGRLANSVDTFSLLPTASVTQTIGTLNMLNTFASNKRLILGGDSTGNVVDTVTWSVTGNQLMLTKAGAGSWTITNNLAFSTNRASRLYVERGTLTLGGTNNSTTHKVGIGSVRESTFTASGTASKLIAKGTFTINDNREYFFVQNLATLSPGPGVGTLTVTWLTNSAGTHGQFNMQTGSTYEWDIASAASTDVVNVQRGGSSSGSLTLGNMTIKVSDAGVATPIAAIDQLPVFTYQTGVTRSLGTITIDTSGLGAGWSGTPSLVDNGTGTIYVTGLTFTPGGPTLDHFAISAISSPQTVGNPITGITITAQDASNATDTSFTGTVTFGGTAGITGTSGTFTAGVLSGVSVTPSVVGTGLTFTVDDGASHTGTTSFDVQSRYAAWSGGAAFNADTNGDGVKNGLAFLLGAANPSENAIGRLPTVTESGGDLVLTFDCLSAANRGAAVLNLQFSNDLGISDPWTGAVVPGVAGTSDDGSVHFVATGTSPIHVVATVSSSEAAAGKLFGRLEAEQP